MDRNHEQGSNVVEMALSLFILLLMLAAIADFGRAFNAQIVITNAAREGARRASRVPNELSFIETATRQEAMNSGIDLNASNARVIVGGLGGDKGRPITVTVEYTMTTFFGGLVGLDELPIRSETQMVIIGLDEP